MNIVIKLRARLRRFRLVQRANASDDFSLLCLRRATGKHGHWTYRWMEQWKWLFCFQIHSFFPSAKHEFYGHTVRLVRLDWNVFHMFSSSLSFCCCCFLPFRFFLSIRRSFASSRARTQIQAHTHILTHTWFIQFSIDQIRTIDTYNKKITHKR